MERRRIVAMDREGRGRVLVTLVRAEGSSYRRTGARMLVGADASYAGTISGGCLEAEVVRKAVWMTRGGAVVERYSTMFDDTAEIPYGLGCGGVLDLLLEPAGTAEYDALLRAVERSLGGEEALVSTWLPQRGRPLMRAVFSVEGEPVDGEFADGEFAQGELRFASPGLTRGKIAAVDGVSLMAGEDAFVERIGSPQRLFVIGAGDDARPVVSMAAMLGWSVTVADGRGQLARPERFPEAERVAVVGSASELGVRGRDAVVVMTHSYEQDREALTAMLALEVSPVYLGLLGSRHRSSLLVSEAAAMLGRSVGECCDRIYAPMGLDLGGDGAGAIALAVVAEVHARVEGRLGASRRLSAEDVAENVERGGASRYLQTQCAL